MTKLPRFPGGAGVATASILALMIWSTACEESGPSRGETGRSTQDVTAEAAPATAPDRAAGGRPALESFSACALLTKEDVLAATTYPQTEVAIVEHKEETPPEPDKVYGRVSECAYKMRGVTREAGGASTKLEGDFWARLTIREKGAPIEFNPSAKAERVEGIGDGAFWYTPAGLRVRVGEISLTISANPPVPSSEVGDVNAAQRAAAETLAKVVVSRLGRGTG